jgi:subtilisin
MTLRPHSATSRRSPRTGRIRSPPPASARAQPYPGGLYGVSSGTSFASPLAAGTVALCLASGKKPCAGLTPAQIIRKIVGDAIAYNTGNPGYGFTGDPLHSPDPNRYYGFLIRAGRD